MNTHISMLMEGVQDQFLPLRGYIKLDLVCPCYKLFFSCELSELSIFIGLSVQWEKNALSYFG